MTEQEAAETSLQVEAEGETVGEAKWTAVRELERRFPGIDKANVRFVVLSEGERGLLGVGFTPARVIASVSGPMASPAAAEEPGSPAALLRELLERVAGALGAPVAITIREDDETMVATLTGPDLGLVIGKHGQTIDAIQYLANAILWRGAEDRKSVVVDAAGYRDRRRASLEQLADRAAGEARAAGRAVALEPMSAVERKIVHLHLQEREEVETTSEGTEPNRYVVVSPLD
jgi:spoIIIJ-associated protein